SRRRWSKQLESLDCGEVIMTPTQVLQRVLQRLRSPDQETESIRADLAALLSEDFFTGDYELAKLPQTPILSPEMSAGADVEIIVEGSGLPDKATLTLAADGNWRLKSYRGQCSGCLGSGTILGRPCRSCGGTGWGLRPL